MLRHELYSMIHVPRLKEANAAELFLGFRIGTVGSCDFAVLPIQGQGGFRRLKRFSAGKVPVGAKMVVVFKACVEHCAPLALGHGFVFAFVVVSQTDVFHCSSPPGESQQHSLASWIVHSIVVAHGKNRQQEANYFRKTQGNTWDRPGVHKSPFVRKTSERSQIAIFREQPHAQAIVTPDATHFILLSREEEEISQSSDFVSSLR